MDEYIVIKLEIKDRTGKSSINIEGQDYQTAKEKVIQHLNFCYKRENFLDISLDIENKEEPVNITRSLDKVNYQVARENVTDFLQYIYNIDEEGSEELKGDIPEMPAMDIGVPPNSQSLWLSNYNIEDMSQKDKLYYLLKHNHPSEWIRSQELKEEYEIVYGERIKLSSVSTYLARFYTKGIIERKGSRAQREYMMSSHPNEASTS